MEVRELDGIILNEMFANGYRNLMRNAETVNDLNVFPVPDGDTGTNMLKTLGGGVSSALTGEDDVSKYMKKFSRETLLSARGNSGVILSQFINGFAKGTEGKTHLTVSDFADAVEKGVESSYSAVITPTEGTILTVIRELAEYLQLNKGKFSDFTSCFDTIIIKMKETLKKTPELLPVLEEAGVVDSGGAGLIYIFEGMNYSLKGEKIDETSAPESISYTNYDFGPDSELEYGYCTEFILQLMNYKTNISDFSIKPVIEFLETVGDSIVAVKDEDLVKIHVHTFEPEKVIAYARQFGEFVTVKIENMSIQHNEVTEKKQKKHKKYAVVSVTQGEGIEKYFSEIGVDVIINGGQTQNPSAQDFIDAFDSVDADYIIVLPNNSNIVLTAMQAKNMYSKADIRVIPTKSIPQGYSALSMMNLSVDTVEEIVSDMESAIKYVTTGSITRAVHDTVMNDVTVCENDYIGIADGKIVCASQDNISAVLDMLKSLEDIDEKQVITIFYGEGIQEDTVEKLISEISSVYPLIECGAVYGGQSVYDFYLAIE